MPGTWSSRPCMAASIEFSGAASGSFMLVADTSAAHALADEFMGFSDDGRDAETSGENADEARRETVDEEVFEELTNILCGALLSRFQPDRCCDLSQPILCSEALAADWRESPGGTDICSGVLLESGFVTGYWKLDGMR
jgi:Chemotaxis phosphatase CheX